MMPKMSWASSSHDQELIIDHRVEMLKQSAPEEAGKPEPQESATAILVLKLTEELGLTEADIKVFEKFNSNKR
jgi:nanoRNase/pAp phosphatase (c-di-AMP/oligoRNAs hydrolase)